MSPIVDGTCFGLDRFTRDYCPRKAYLMPAFDPAPRTFRAGDPEPHDVRCVLDNGGVVHQRRDDQTLFPGDYWCAYGWEQPVSWADLMRYGPVVEVRLPGPPS